MMNEPSQSRDKINNTSSTREILPPHTEYCRHDTVAKVWLQDGRCGWLTDANRTRMAIAHFEKKYVLPPVSFRTSLA